MNYIFMILFVGFAAIFAPNLHAIPLHKVENKCVQPSEFNKNQKAVILKAFKYGLKTNYAYTMAAIAWQESCAGEYRVNFSDPSAGIYHAHIPGVIKKAGKSDGGFMRNMVGELLIRDDEYASSVALEELLYWGRVRSNDWQKIIKSYNKGFSWEKDRERAQMAQRYYDEIALKVVALQVYMQKTSPSLAKQAAKNDLAILYINKHYPNVIAQNSQPLLNTNTQGGAKGGSAQNVNAQGASAQKPAIKQTPAQQPKSTQPQAPKTAPKKLNGESEFFLLQEM